tara:strand:+ start:1478 stop:2527 length:1050 start_codon:yes stop_codon:yes gene_type:complete
MKFYKLIIFILVIFLKTGNVLSETKIFDVNNIEIEKKGKTPNEALANQAIKKGFNQLIEKILLKEDIKKLKGLKFSEIKELVTYYQISNKTADQDITLEKINFNISFDKDKIHDLFYKRTISYSDIANKELYILPILKKENQIFIYNQNYFYDNWNKFYDTELIEFILPLENIEIVQNISINKNNILNLNLKNLFKEYVGKNLAIVLIEVKDTEEEKIYFKTVILGKIIVKNFNIKRNNLNNEAFNKKIITKTKQEIIDLIKSQNLIDIRTPSFLNARFTINNKNNLVDLKSRLQKIDLIENIYIKEFNNETVLLKIKYLGKLNKIINQLEDQEIILKIINDLWSIRII